METPRVGTGKALGSKTTQFKPGWKGGPGRPRASGNEEPAMQANPLADMLHVYNNPPPKDKTPGQKRCRQFLEEDYKGFIALYVKLEEARQSSVAAAATSDSEETSAPGEKELRIEELAERLLAEWEAEERQHSEHR